MTLFKIFTRKTILTFMARGGGPGGYRRGQGPPKIEEL